MPFRRPYVELPALPDQRLGVIRPHPGRVHDLLRADLVLPAALHVAHRRADDPLALAQEPDHPRPVGAVRPVRRGRPHQRGDVPRVVHLGVVVLQGPHQRVLAQRRSHPQGLGARQVAVDRQPAPVPAGEGHGVVQRDAGARVEPLPGPVLERVQERHRLHQVRRQPPQQQAALLERLPHEGEVEHLQVPQSAVDQLAGPAGGARGPVPRLHQAGRQPSGHGVQRGSGSHHARAHHQYVQFPLGHPGERLGALDRSQCRCPHDCLPLVIPLTSPVLLILTARTRIGHRLWTTQGRPPPRNATFLSYIRLV